MKLAMVFPGQGSQSVGMMQGYGDLPAVRAVLAEASDVLGMDMAKLMSEGPAEALNSTVNTQPVMVTAGYAAYCAWREQGGPEPSVVAGHSLGEYTALVVSGAISFADCLPLVRYRAEAMQLAVPAGVGAMAAVLGLDDAGISAACAEAAQGEVVDRHCRPCRCGAKGHRRVQGARGEARHCAAGERAVSLRPDGPGCRKARRLPGKSCHQCSAHSGIAQSGCANAR